MSPETDPAATASPASPAASDRRDPAVDQQLLGRVAAGDRAALATLYRGYHRRLCRFLAQMTRRPELIDEVVNDTFWVVWQKAASFRGDSRPSTWLMGIAYRCTLKALRRHGDEALGDPDWEDGHDPQPEHELRDWLAKGLDRLPPEQRQVLALAYGAGHSVDEIAAIMQCPEGTVKARLFHARMKLRHLLPQLAERQAAAATSAARPLPQRPGGAR